MDRYGTALTILFLLFSFLLLVSIDLVSADFTGQSSIPSGEFTPQYGVKDATQKLQVKPFFLDRIPVTNKKFLEFLSTHPEWKRGKIISLFADENYLKHWDKEGDEFVPKATAQNSPVTNVSWYAANEYCTSKGMRLPTVLEWEFVGAASESKPDASKDPEFVQRLLGWYSKPNSKDALTNVGKEPPNYWGVYNMHGLIWEWNSDFNSVFVAGDNRRDSEQLKNLFCGTGATGSTDKANYAAYMRYALRNSLEARFTMETLGFRCARDAVTKTTQQKR